MPQKYEALASAMLKRKAISTVLHNLFRYEFFSN